MERVPPGGRLVICTPSRADAGRVLRGIAAGMEHPAGLMIASGAESRTTGSRGEPRAILLSGGGTLPQAVTAIRHALTHPPKTTWLLLDGSTLPRRWAGSAAKRLQLFASVQSLTAKLRLRSVLVIVQNESDPREIAALKDEGEFFLHFVRVWRGLQGQLLTARGMFTPGLFDPSMYDVDGVPVAVPATATPEPPSIAPGDALFNGSPDPLALLDLRGSFRQFNRPAVALLGYPAEELAGLTLSDVVPSSSMPAALRFLAAVRRGGQAQGSIELRRRNGRTIRVALTGNVISGSMCCVSFRDVTGSWKQQQELTSRSGNAASILERLPYPSAVFSDRRLVSFNPAFRSAFHWLDLSSPRGVTLTQVIGRQGSAQVQAVPGDGEQGSVRFETEIDWRDGSRRWFDVAAASVLHNGKPALHLLLADAGERRALIERLTDSAEYFRNLVEGSPDALAVVREGLFLYVNRSLAALGGFASPEELVGREVAAFWTDPGPLTPGTRKGKRVAHSDTLLQIPGKRKDGARILTEVHAAPITTGGAPALLVCVRDITVRKAEEQAAALRQKGLELALDIERELGTVLDPEPFLQGALHALMKAMGAEAGGILLVKEGARELELAGPVGLSEKLGGILAAHTVDEGTSGYVIKTQEPLLLALADYPAYLPYRSVFEREGLPIVLYLPLVAGGTTRGILFAARRRAGDIPPVLRSALDPLVHRLGQLLARAKGHAAVRVAEERYRSAVESIADVIYQVAPNGSTQFISPNVQRLLGYSPEEFFRTGDLWRMILHPDDRSVYAQRISNQTLPSDDFHLEYRVLPKGKASYRWVRDSIRYKRSEDGALFSINGILSDITDRIELEAALIKSEEMKTNVLESLQEGVMVLDTGFQCIDWNRSMEGMTGVMRAGVIGKSVFDVVGFLGADAMRHLLDRVLLGESLSTDDVPLPSAEGVEARFLWVRFSPLRDSTETIRGVVGIVTDISARKRLEREVRESEETLRNVIDAMGDALMISDLRGKVWEVNREFSRVTGYARSEVLGMAFPYSWLVEEEMARFVTWIAELREKNYLRDFDMTWRRKDGQTIAISLNTTMLRNAVGEPVAMLNIARDISDRRRLALELERKNRQIELINRIISKANSTMEFPEIFDTIAREVAILTAFDRIGVCLLSNDGRSLTVYAFRDVRGPDTPLTPGRIATGMTVDIRGTVAERAVLSGRPVVTHERGSEYSGTLLDEGMESQISVPFSLKDRVVGAFFLGSATHRAFTGEEPAFLQPIADQIGVVVDRIRLFQKVSEDSEYIHTLVNSIDSVVFTIDQHYRITEANKAWRVFALEQGMENVADEVQIIGMGLDELLGGQRSWAPEHEVLELLFNRSMDIYSHEVELHTRRAGWTYHLSITPMVIEDRVTGLVFTLTDITEIKRTEAEVRQRNKELIALNTISAAISTSLNLDQVLQVAAEQIRHIVGAELVMLYLHEKGRDRLSLACSVGLVKEHAEHIRTLMISESATGAVILAKRPLYIPSGLMDDFRITGAGREVFASVGINSLGVIPLQSKEEVLGALDVAFAATHEFSEQERQLLLLIGNQLGPAIENAQLYAEVQAQVDRITVLYELGKRLTGTLDTRTLLDSVWTEAVKILPADRFIYAAYAGSGDALSIVYHAEGTERTYFGMEGSAGGPPAGPAALLLDVAVQERSLRLDGSHPDGAGESLIAVPVRSKARVIGVLALSTKGARVYSEVHLRLLESIGNLTEISIEKALLYEDTIAKSMEIAERNKELDDFTYVVSHDLKEPLISIEGYSRILLKDYREKVDEDGKEYLNSVVQSTGRMKSLIDDLLTLSRLGRVSESQEMVSSNRVVQEILHDLRFTIEDKGVRVTAAEDLPDVRYNATQLTMVFRNLIANALKFNDKPDPAITIGCERRRDHVVFSVTDNGIGIEPQYYEKIFLIFQRLQRSEAYRGTGAGLTIVKKIVEKHRGRIWVESVVGSSTTFFFTVPIQG
jgi:PAS domain S-box-containing protein